MKLHLIGCMILHSHSLESTCQTGQLNENMTGIITPATFKSLMRALMSVVLPHLKPWLWFTHQKGRGVPEPM